jgi:hypothetical protein
MSLMILAAVAVPVLSAGLPAPDAARSIRPGGPMSPAQATGNDAEIVMVDRRSRRKDITSALSRAGSFRTTWLRSG